MSSKIKVYLSGPITGIESKSAPMFSEAENDLTQQGYHVVNPWKLDHTHDQKWENYMATDITALLECDCICMLPGWEHSRGARLELAIAMNRGMSYIYWKEPSPGCDRLYPPGEADFL
ncbi:MAG TPA: DUF4406 domain-containing protein [Dissulfurispiraceae bacterium]|nr:DUF4406 domain-containing protein [Dissulfurispiraceae bacterium]